MKQNFFFIILLFLAFSCHSQSFNSEKTDSLLQLLEQNNKFMGTVALSKNGAVVYSKSIGYADVEINQQIDNNTKFRIGSISKMFTAVLVLKAVEEKKIKLEDKLSKFYPKIANSGKISIENMLYHRSGIHSFTDDSVYYAYYINPVSSDKILNSISSYKSDFEPNSKFQYSNSNFYLLSIILENIYGTSYKELLEKYITKPLKLNYTKFGEKINPKNNEAYSYVFKEKWSKEAETDMSVPLGAGAVVSTPSDLITFIESLFAEKIISKTSLDKMLTLKDNFGMGIFRVPFYEKNGFGHGGSIDAFRSLLYYFPDEKITICVISNTAMYENNSIAVCMLSSLFGKDFQLPEFKIYSVKADDLDKYVGVYASKEIPIKVTISKKGETLFAQGSGQAEIALTPTERDVFCHEAVGLKMIFIPVENKFILKQGGGTFNFIKEK